MRTSFISLVTLALWMGSTDASLYPTQPIAKTVFHGGTWNNVTWIDSKSKPSLDELGKLRIDLWVDDARHIACLATDVEPRKMSQKVFIPAELWTNSLNFVIRFNSRDPPTTIYTADFAITNMTGNRSALSDNKPPAAKQGTESAAATGVGIDDMVTVTMETTASSAPTLPFLEPTSAGAVSAMANDASSGRRRFRSENMQFNLVFVLFPALFGLALAL